MTLDLVLVDDSGRKRLFRHLAVVDLLLHGALGEEAVDVDGLSLAKAAKKRQFSFPVWKIKKKLRLYR